MRLITWNSQGITRGGYEWRLEQGRPDVMVVQEVGDLPSTFGVDVSTLRFGVPAKVGELAGYTCWWCGWTKADADGQLIAGHAGNLRCSMAMFFTEPGAPTAVRSTVEERRPVLRKTIGNYVVSNIHAGGLEYIDAAIAMTRLWGTGKRWAVAGDFNQDPATVRRRLPQDEFVVAPPSATRPRSGRTIDFAASNRDGTASVGPQYEGSDHLSVTIELS